MLRTSESFISKQIWEQQFLRTATRHVEYVKHEKIKKKQQNLVLLEQVLSNYFDENREETAKPLFSPPINFTEPQGPLSNKPNT